MARVPKKQLSAAAEEESVIRFFQERKLTQAAENLTSSDYQPSEDVQRVILSTKMLEKEMELEEINSQLFDLNLRLKTDAVFHPMTIGERIGRIDALIKHLQYLIDSVKEIDEFVLISSPKTGDTISVPEYLHRYVSALPQALLISLNSLPGHFELLTSFASKSMNYDTVKNLQILRLKVAEVVRKYKEMEKFRKNIKDIMRSKYSVEESELEGKPTENVTEDLELSVIEPINKLFSNRQISSTPK